MSLTIPTPRLSKKLSFAVLVVACATALAWHGTLSAAEWRDLVEWTGVAYIGAQGAVDVAAALKAPKT